MRDTTNKNQIGLMNEKTIGVLIMAYGSPDSLDDMPAYLSDIAGAGPCRREFVAEFRNRYAQIGGQVSPE